MEPSARRARTILVLLVAVIFVWMVRSILVPIVLAGIFALLLHPLHLRLGRRLGRFRRLSPLLVTIGALILLVLPLSGIAAQAVVSINDFLGGLGKGEVSDLQSSILKQVRQMATAVGIPFNEIREAATQMVQRAGTAIAGFLSGFLGSIPNMVIDIFLFVLALYFFLRDGDRLGQHLRLLSPFEEEETDALFGSVVETVRGAILGTVAVAFVQGALTILALYIFRVPGPFLFGLIAAFLSLIPIVGTTPVTVGAVIYLLTQDRIGAAVGMSVAVVVIGLSDNFVRPWVQSLEGRMHPLMALLGIFGGLAVMGAAGIFIGPVVSALVIWVVKLLARKQRETKQTVVVT